MSFLGLLAGRGGPVRHVGGLVLPRAGLRETVVRVFRRGANTAGKPAARQRQVVGFVDRYCMGRGKGVDGETPRLWGQDGEVSRRAVRELAERASRDPHWYDIIVSPHPADGEALTNRPEVARSFLIRVADHLGAHGLAGRLEAGLAWHRGENGVIHAQGMILGGAETEGGGRQWFKLRREFVTNTLRTLASEEVTARLGPEPLTRTLTRTRERTRELTRTRGRDEDDELTRTRAEVARGIWGGPW